MSSTAFPYKPPNRQELLDLIEENERLKRENVELFSRFVTQKQEYEAEKASYTYIYGTKIDALEKELKKMITKSNELRHKFVKTEEIMRALSRLINRARLGEQAEKMQETLENGEAVGRRHPLEDLCNEIERILEDTGGTASRGTLFSSTRSRFSSMKARPKTLEQPHDIFGIERGLSDVGDLKSGKGLSEGQNRRSSAKLVSHMNHSTDGEPEEMPSGIDAIDKEDIVLDSAAPVRWMPNDASDHCQLCKSQFHLFKRRHHCRACGTLVCHDCSPYEEHAVGYREKKVRICEKCLKRMKRIKNLSRRKWSIYSSYYQSQAGF